MLVENGVISKTGRRLHPRGDVYRVDARGRVVIQKALSADHEVRVAETNRRGHATRLTRGAANDDGRI